MLNDLAGHKWNIAEYTVDGKTMKFRSFSEFRDVLDYVSFRAAEETGTVAGRTTARSVRRN